MTEPDLDRAREFIASVPWRQVGNRPGGPLNKPAEPHEYVIGRPPGGLDTAEFWWLVDLIREHGYRGKYTAPYNDRTMVNRYLVIDQHVYWSIRSQPSLNRTPVEHRQHEPIDDSTYVETREPEQAQMVLDLGGAR